MFKLDEKLDIYNKARASKNKNRKDEALFDLAKFYYEINEIEKAKISFKKLSDENFPKSNYYLALIELNDEKVSKAITYLNKELKIVKHANYAKVLKEKLEVHSNVPLVTINLFLLNILIFYFVPLENSLVNLIKFGLFNFDLSLAKAFTSLFFHINIWHLVVNMLILIIFGFHLEKYIGSYKFLSIYIISGMVGNVIQTFATTDAIVVGASTAIFGIIGATVMREPLLKLNLFGFIKVPLILFFGFFFLLDNFIVFYTNDLIVNSNIAHIIGFLIGVLLTGIYYNDTIEVFYNWLGISVGFLAIFYAIDLTLIQVFNLNTISLMVLGYLVGAFLIFYSYFKLKMIREEVVQEWNQINWTIVKLILIG